MPTTRGPSLRTREGNQKYGLVALMMALSVDFEEPVCDAEDDSLPPCREQRGDRRVGNCNLLVGAEPRRAPQVASTLPEPPLAVKRDQLDLGFPAGVGGVVPVLMVCSSVPDRSLMRMAMAGTIIAVMATSSCEDLPAMIEAVAALMIVVEDLKGRDDCGRAA